MEQMRFGESGVLQGMIGDALTPESFVALGGGLGKWGKAALGWSGGDAAAMLARALGAGICAGGGTVLAHDGCCSAAGAWMGEYYDVPISLFVEQEGDRVFLHCFGRNGLSPEWGEQEIVGANEWVQASYVGKWDSLVGVNTAYAADAARRGSGGVFHVGVTVCVPGESLWDQILTNTLERMGCRVLRKITSGIPSFATTHGGFWPEGWTEDGERVEPMRMLALAARLEMERSDFVAAPLWAPTVMEKMAAELGRTVLRLSRDKGAREVYAKTPWLRDALFAVAFFVSAMGREQKRFEELLTRVPPFALRRVEIDLQRSGEQVMDAFTGHFRRAEPAGNGVRLRSGRGSVTVMPLSRRDAVRVQAEGMDVETAEELCAFYEEEIRQLDK